MAGELAWRGESGELRLGHLSGRVDLVEVLALRGVYQGIELVLDSGGFATGRFDGCGFVQGQDLWKKKRLIRGIGGCGMCFAWLGR